MAGFDTEGARKAGYSDTEIADHLAQEAGFDANAARKAGYKDAEIVQHLTTQSPQEPGILKKAWGYATAPMRKVAEIGGRMDVDAGTKTPEEAAGNVEKYGDLATRLATIGLGGAATKAAMRGSEFAAAGGRALTQGGLDASQAEPGSRSREFLRGALSGAAGEATSGLGVASAKKIMDPLGVVKAAKLAPRTAPRAGEEWTKFYHYGKVPGATEPMLTKDVLRNTQRAPTGFMASSLQAGQSGYNMFLDWLRQQMEGNPEKPGIK